MTHMVQFIHLFRNQDGWRTSVQLPEEKGWAGSRNVPSGLKPEWFTRVGVDHLRSRLPLEFDLGEIRPGQKAGVFFADISNVRERRLASDAATDVLAAAVDAAAEAAKAEPAPAAAIETDLV